MFNGMTDASRGVELQSRVAVVQGGLTINSKSNYTKECSRPTPSYSVSYLNFPSEEGVPNHGTKKTHA